MALIGTINASNDFGLKNRIINGAMVIDQRNAGASVTQTAGVVYNTLDRWRTYGNITSKFTVQQNAGSLTGLNLPAGFTNYVGVTSSAATTLSAGDVYRIEQSIEGYNIADLNFGNANAKTITVSFWVRSSLTGTFGGALWNVDASRSYVFSYTISSANTWEQKTVTIAGDTSGTWNTTNSQGLVLQFSLGAGSTYLSTAGSWSSNFYTGVTGQVNVVGTSGATFYITGVQLEKGSTATSFDYRPYGTELALCQRYFYKTYNTDVAVGITATIGTVYCETLAEGALSRLKAFNPRLPVSMRVTPTVTLYSQTGTVDRINVYNNNGSTLTVSSITGSGTNSLLNYLQTSTNAVAAQTYEFHATASAEL
jgi:hypothetical protein